MKRKMKKKLIAFMLCMVLVICNSVSILADTPAAATTTAENQVSETKTAKNEKSSEENKSTDDNDTSKQSEETDETKDEAPEVTTTEKKEETTEATTEDKEDATTATTEAEETTTEATTEDKATTEAADETSESDEKKEATTAEEEKTTAAKENTEAPTELTYENDEVKITVNANVENAIPEGTTLKVVPVLKDDKETSEQYQEVEKKLEEKAIDEEYDIAGFLAYDITFVDEDGNKVEPDGEVQVSMEYKESAVPVEIKEDTTDSNVTVMHLEENEEGQVKEVVDMSKNDQLKNVKTTETQKIEKAEFVTDSFSVFTITWIRKSGEEDVFNFSKEIHMVKASRNSFIDMRAQIGEGNLTLTTEDANPVLYTNTISSSGSNSELYSVDENGQTYRFAGAYISTTSEQYGQTYYNIDDDAKKIEKLTGRENSSGQKVMMCQFAGDNSYRNIETDQVVVFVYSNSDLTTSAQCYSQNGTQVRTRDVSLINIGESLDVQKDNYIIPNIDNYTYLYTVVGEGDEAVEVNYLRYVNGYLQYSLDGTNWSDVNSEPVKFIYKKGASFNIPANEIETADTRGLIDIDLFDFSKSIWGKTTCGLSFSDGEWTGSEEVTSGLVKDELNQNGFPVSMNNNNMDPLFDGTSQYVSSNGKHYDLNHLFSYDAESGEYSYDSDEHYAYYDINSNNTERNFIVYNTEKYKGSGHHKKGAFMPFASWGNTSDDNMYLFSMKVSFDFIQPVDGLVNGKDMEFSFSGDDDVWVFVDGKLVLDLGGVHDRASGSINFKTGKVMVNGAEDDSLQEIFGELFNDNTTHHLDFFYMERGKGESNCSLKFNLPPKQRDTIEITKEITNTDRDKYANVEFSFKAYLQDEEYEGETVYEVIPEGTEYKVKKNGTLTGEIRTVGDGNIFKLKSGETAVFENINSDLKYYVEEIGVDSDEFDQVEIEGWEVDYINDEGELIGSSGGIVNPDTDYIAKSEEKIVGENAVIKFKNRCSESNKNELQITKQMEEGQTSSDKFSFLIKLENTDGELVPYEGEYYIIKEEKNEEGEIVRKYYNSNLEEINEGKAGDVNEGIVAGIPVGYTVVITQIMSGTTFDVEEWNLNTNIYLDPTIEVEAGTAADPDVVDDEGKQIGLGSIKLGKGISAKVTVTNRKKTKNIYAQKSWNDELDNSHRTDVLFGLFRQDATGLSLIQTKLLSETTEWRCTFENVAAVDEKNNEINYQVKEIREVSFDESNRSDVYKLTENGIVKYYQVIDATDTITDNNFINEYYEISREVTGSGIETDPYVITNSLKTFNINVVKTGGDDTLLAGVEFQLCKDADGNQPLKFTDNDNGNYVYSKAETGVTTTLRTVNNTGTNSDGKYNPNLKITGLPAGTYYLIETKTVEGHSLLANPVKVELPATNTDGKDKGYYYTETENGETTYYYDVNTFNIKNNKLFTMPEAGGRNIFMMTIAGTAMIALAAGSTIYYRRRRGAHNKTGR
ncbi:MAG TPA: fibro-slime domain-containing protein [Candidatus Anaerobutyricum stercoris]|uniref:Fibro-slime domain-containing protein n=1 Tax=Candidatus Anaerobutyricum stercoris TaxID=2838457 RepID=A0A9D2J850_9FIRM|nr:fibro-slime domain-containing protein [Candidatus Anaerobutyricum stercoris]